MFKMNGQNDFNSVFDFFKWSAPVYETPEEVVSALGELDFSGKEIKEIAAIGSTDELGLPDSVVYRRILAAGAEIGSDWKTAYPNMKNVIVPCRARLCEPVQFIFTDGSTFEFIPMANGGARFACDTIPAGLTTGLNYPNFDLQKFFGDGIKGASIKTCSMRESINRNVFYDAGRVGRGKPFEQTRTEYRYVFDLSNVHKVSFSMSRGGWFWIEYGMSEADGIPYPRIEESLLKNERIYIASGRCEGGTFWIQPVSSKGEPAAARHSISDYENCGISVYESDVQEFLDDFLYKYFDETIQELYGAMEIIFDWYGKNLYTYESVRGMIADIRETARLLREDYENPQLDYLKSRFVEFAAAAAASGEEPAVAAVPDKDSKTVSIAADFYDRFATRMEVMLAESPDCDMIAFSGP